MTKKAILIAGFCILLILMMRPFWATEFRHNEHAIADCPDSFFTKAAKVFDAVTICATARVSDAKLKHAAAVTAEWIDNDADGKADSLALVKSLRENSATLLMSKAGFSDPAAEKLSFFEDKIIMQDLAANETNPPLSRRDASQEEIHHLLWAAGWRKLYPMVFDAENKNSALYKVWSRAENLGFYHYDDPTCDEACKSVEFLYLATAAYLGSDADLYSDEMRLKSRLELEKKLPKIVQIIENPANDFAHNHWPKGSYAYPQHIQYLHQ